MILLAMLDNSGLDVGAKSTSWQVSDEVSTVLKKSGITGVPRLLLILTIFSSKKWTTLLARLTAEELLGKRLSAFLWRRPVIVRNGFAVTFSWIDKARIVIHFLLENGVLYNNALVRIRFQVGSELGTTPSIAKKGIISSWEILSLLLLPSSS